MRAFPRSLFLVLLLAPLAAATQDIPATADPAIPRTPVAAPASTIDGDTTPELRAQVLLERAWFSPASVWESSARTRSAKATSPGRSCPRPRASWRSR